MDNLFDKTNSFDIMTDTDGVAAEVGKITHEMKLNPSPFAMIKSGRKNIELRLYDERRKNIRVGDDIIFTHTESGERMCATVKGLHIFASFDELYKNLPLLQCGYTPEDVDMAKPSDMNQYYTPEQQSMHGVVGIELLPPKMLEDKQCT